MPKIAIGFGLVLTAIGVAFYFATHMVSITALIPAFAGVPLALIGVAAAGAGEGARKHLMHAAVSIGLLGFLAPAGRLVSKGFAGATPVIAEESIMALLCLAFVGLCVRSFVQARRSRTS